MSVHVPPHVCTTCWCCSLFISCIRQQYKVKWEEMLHSRHGIMIGRPSEDSREDIFTLYILPRIELRRYSDPWRRWGWKCRQHLESFINTFLNFAGLSTESRVLGQFWELEVEKLFLPGAQRRQQQARSGLMTRPSFRFRGIIIYILQLSILTQHLHHEFQSNTNKIHQPIS